MVLVYVERENIAALPGTQVGVILARDFNQHDHLWGVDDFASAPLCLFFAAASTASLVTTKLPRAPRAIPAATSATLSIKPWQV